MQAARFPSLEVAFPTQDVGPFLVTGTPDMESSSRAWWGSAERGTLPDADHLRELGGYRERLTEHRRGNRTENNYQIFLVVAISLATAEARSAGGQEVWVPRLPSSCGSPCQRPQERQGPARPMAWEVCVRQCRLHTCGFTSFSSQLDSKSVKHTAFSLISVILKRALKTIDHCLDKEVWQGSGVYTAALMEEFVRLFREALSKVGAAAAVAIPDEVLEPSLQPSQASTPGEETVPGARRLGVKRSAVEGSGAPGPPGSSEVDGSSLPSCHAHIGLGPGVGVAARPLVCLPPRGLF